jgi:hypothetical protein
VAVTIAAETRSFERAAVLMLRVLEHGLSAKTIERLAHEIGSELAALLAGETPLDEREVIVPETAVVSCDGGRIRTRAAGRGPGVHDAQWRESKNALFERMAAPHAMPEDPCPQLPDTFRSLARAAKIAEKPVFEGDFSAGADEPRPRYQGPKRILRTCLGSLANSAEFGLQMRREAKRRRFDEAPRRVFLGDGLPWNWTIQREHFAGYVPILDFIHAVQYLYAAAAAWEADDACRGARYRQLTEAVWQGRVAEVIDALRRELTARGVEPGSDLPDDHPLAALHTAARYFTNNRSRMDYPRYRREGLPITSAPMESLIKQLNYRVKGTEMFWNAPAGAEAILQLRAAALCDDDRLTRHLLHRPGHTLTRRRQETAA